MRDNKCPICSLPRKTKVLWTNKDGQDYSIPIWDGHEACEQEMQRQRDELEAQQQRQAEEKKRREHIESVDAIFLEAFLNPEKINIDKFVINKDNSKAYEALKNYDFRDETNSGIVLFGSPGTGKTHMVAGFAYRLLGNKTIKTLAIFRLKRFIEATMAIQDFNDRERYLTSLKYCQLVVIDDVGTEKLTEWGESQLEDLIDGRISLGNHTWITTNLDPDGLKTVLTPRLVSRLQTLRFIKVPGIDQRRLKAK